MSRTTSSGLDQLYRLFKVIRQRAGALHPHLGHTHLRHCTEADEEHRQSARQFMHVGHVPSAICYAKATVDLAAPWQTGLLAHEFGHLTHGAADHTEIAANQAGGRILGSPVRYRGPLRLEHAAPPKEVT